MSNTRITHAADCNSSCTEKYNRIEQAGSMASLSVIACLHHVWPAVGSLTQLSHKNFRRELYIAGIRCLCDFKGLSCNCVNRDTCALVADNVAKVTEVFQIGDVSRGVLEASATYLN